MLKNRNLLIIALIAVVNALGYGIIIPILYSYSQRFGLSDFQNGLLFSIFSVFQFGSTPFIGRMSDKFGRRPLLLISLCGTAASFFMAAFAPSAAFLFIARALDGLTAGNIPVAAAVISDSTDTKDRVRGFGIIGASFGFGFVFGPAISALTVQLSPNLPFIIAGTISLLAVVLTAIFLPETNKHMGEVRSEKIFDFGAMAKAAFNGRIGDTLLTTLFYSLAFGMFIYGFQPFSVKEMKLSAGQISLIFTIFGAIGLISQMIILPQASKRLGLKKIYRTAIILSASAFLSISLVQTLSQFIIASIFLSLSNSFVNPLLQTILSREVDEKSQGSIQGLNASYMSIGTIFGPIIGGTLATLQIRYPFLGGAVFVLVCIFLSFRVLKGSMEGEVALTK